MANGEFRDDATIPDDAELWRRVPPQHFVLDENEGAIRPSSAAFDDDRDGSPMSVFIGSEMESTDPALAVHDGYALASFTAGEARDCGQRLMRDPLPGSPAHAVVFGPKPKSVRKKLGRAARWVVPPPE